MKTNLNLNLNLNLNHRLKPATRKHTLVLAMIAGLVAVGTTGCSSTKVSRENAAGDKFSARNTRWFWKSEGIDVAFASKPDGTVEATAKIQNSSAEADQLKSAVSDVLDKLEKVK